MDTELIRKRISNPACTRQELEQMLKDALSDNERELAYEIKDVLDERFTDWNAPAHSRGGATETIATFRSTAKHFPTAKEAYVWLVNCFIGVKPEVFTNIRWETTGYVAVGQRRNSEGAIRNYFARNPQKLFYKSPWLAENHNNYVRLQNGWYANSNLSNAEKFDILVRFGWVVELKCGHDWDWEVLDPSEGLRDRQERIALGERLSAELDSLLSQPSLSQT